LWLGELDAAGVGGDDLHQARSEAGEALRVGDGVENAVRACHGIGCHPRGSGAIYIEWWAQVEVGVRVPVDDDRRVRQMTSAVGSMMMALLSVSFSAPLRRMRGSCHDIKKTAFA
jgi:hypothetical protein